MTTPTSKKSIKTTADIQNYNDFIYFILNMWKLKPVFDSEIWWLLHIIFYWKCNLSKNKRKMKKRKGTTQKAK